MATLSTMESAINERVMRIFSERGYADMKAGKTIFSEEFDLDRSNFSKYSSLDRAIPLESLVKLSNKLNISLDWIIKGEESSGSQHATAGRDISNQFQAGRDVKQDGGSSDLKALLEAAHLRIKDLEARIKDKEEMIEFLKQQKKG